MSERPLNQFNSWKTDLSRVPEFENVKIFGNFVVVEVFKEDTTSNNERVNIIVNQTASGAYEYKSDKVGALIHPIGKILAIGDQVQRDFGELKVGDIVLLPDYLKSMVDNPEFIQLMMGSRGNEIPKATKGMTRKVMKIDDAWSKFRFKVNKLDELTPQDAVTYLVPCNSMSIVGVYKNL